jgi:hypothetical protein
MQVRGQVQALAQSRYQQAVPKKEQNEQQARDPSTSAGWHSPSHTQQVPQATDRSHGEGADDDQQAEHDQYHTGDSGECLRSAPFIGPDNITA